MLEEDNERGGAEERGILAVKLRSGVFGGSVGGRLGSWVGG